MDYKSYRDNYYTDPQPEPRFDLFGVRGATLYYKDYGAAVDFYTRVFGPPGYVEGEFTRGWRLGNTWLTLFRAKSGSPVNAEVPLYCTSRAAVDALYEALIAAGAKGEPPAENLMYRPVYMAIVTDPFGVTIDVVCELGV